MDIASILGLIVFIGAVYLGLSDNPGWVDAFLNPTSFYIVILGTAGIVLYRSTLGEFMNMWRVLFGKMFWHQKGQTRRPY